MLVLSRKSMQRIDIGSSIVITVLEIGHNRVRIGIDAPTDTPILRSELSQKQIPRPLPECELPGLPTISS